MNVNVPIPKVIVLDGGIDSFQELAEYLFNKSVADPEQLKIFNQLLSDDRLDRKNVLAAGFTFGVVCAMHQLSIGNIKPFPEG